MIQPNLVRRQRLFLVVLSALIAATIAVSMGLGYSSVSYGRLIPTLLGHGTFKEDFVFFSVRLPRIVVTLLAGMALAVSGAILQGITRNDLADPGIIGINSGAGVGVALFFLYTPLEAGTFAYLLPVAAFAGATLAALLIYGFSHERGTGMHPVRFVLIGIGLSTALSGLMIVMISSAERMKVDFIAKWLAGGIWGTDWPFILALLPWLIVGIPFTFFRSHRLSLLGLGEAAAVGVGVAVKRERLVLLLAAVALAASAVSVTGGIAFVGLMAPHMARALVGPRQPLLLPVAALLGGWLLLLADTVGRNLAGSEGVPAGIVVALIGAPYFIYLLLKK